MNSAKKIEEVTKKTRKTTTTKGGNQSSYRPPQSPANLSGVEYITQITLKRKG